MADARTLAGEGWRRALLDPKRFPIVIPVLAVVIALAAGFFAILATGKDPISGYAELALGGFGSRAALGETAIKAGVLLLTGLSVLVAFRAGLFNIGAEGQFIVGAITAAAAGHAFGGLPKIVALPLVLALVMIAGAVWGLLPAWLKVRRGVHEVISTILLNWIATYLVESWLVTGPLAARAVGAEPGTVSIAGTAEVGHGARLPRFVPQSRLDLGIFLALGTAALVWWLLARTAWGLEIRATGASPRAARAAGIPTGRRAFEAMGLAGALAGLSGALLILGTEFRYPGVFRTGYGFDGIAIALVGGLHPAGAAAAAIFFGAVRAGSMRLQLLGIHRSFADILQGLAVLVVAGHFALQALLLRLRGPDRPPAHAVPTAAPNPGGAS